jgi:hypothetical protein
MTPDHCPHCGARVINREATHCWLCGASLTDAAPGHRPQPSAAPDEALTARPPLERRVTGRRPDRRPPPEEPATDNPVIALLGLLLVFALFSLAQAGALGFAIGLAVVVTPALARVVYFNFKQNATNKRPLTAGENVLFFFTSLGVVTMIGVAAGAAFFATCFVVCLGGLGVAAANRTGGPWSGLDWVLYVSVGLGLIPGIAVAVLLGRTLWAKKL